MARDELIYLRHILDAINTVEEYLRGASEDQFNKTRLLQTGSSGKLKLWGRPFDISQRTFAGLIQKSPGKMLRECGISSSMTTLALTLKKSG